MGGEAGEKGLLVGKGKGVGEGIRIKKWGVDGRVTGEKRARKREREIEIYRNLKQPLLTVCEAHRGKKRGDARALLFN